MRILNAKFGWQALGCLLSAICILQNTKGLDGTEFSGGSATGPLLTASEVGLPIFVLAFFLTFVHRRFAATLALAGSLLALPLYLYFVAPGPFRWVFRGAYSVPLTSNFVWAGWPVAGIVAFAVTAWVGLRGFLT